ncbi:MAG: PHP domain-containing protein [Flavobacteriaceae bacterium]
MNYLRLFLAICLITSLTNCGTKSKQAVEEEASEPWYKGNLHTHSYWSDGDEFPEVILDWYKSKGYDFVALSDHNTLAEGENWAGISPDTLYQNAFKRYLEKYGEDWVSYRLEAGALYVKLKTFEEYRKITEEPGKFLVIQAEEITDRFEDKHLHMNAINIQERIDPKGGASVSEVLQNNIDQVLEQRKKTGVPILPHINHPNFFYSISLQDMYGLKGERFFEVFNGHPMVHNMGDSTNVSTEEMWDLINISYIEQKKPLMYGLATDDSHHYHRKGEKWSNAGRGWVMVKADTLAANSLIKAMEDGNFYSSTGVTLKTLSFKDNLLSVEVSQEVGIDYTIEFIGLRTGATETEVLKTIKGASANFELTKDVVFVRSKITSSKKPENPIENIRYEMAWTQPLLNEVQEVN